VRLGQYSHLTSNSNMFKGTKTWAFPTVLPQLASMKVEMDGLAKQTVITALIGPIIFQLPDGTWCCYIAGQRLTKHIVAQL